MSTYEQMTKIKMFKNGEEVEPNTLTNKEIYQKKYPQIPEDLYLMEEDPSICLPYWLPTTDIPAVATSKELTAKHGVAGSTCIRTAINLMQLLLDFDIDPNDIDGITVSLKFKS